MHAKVIVLVPTSTHTIGLGEPLGRPAALEFEARARGSLDSACARLGTSNVRVDSSFSVAPFGHIARVNAELILGGPIATLCRVDTRYSGNFPDVYAVTLSIHTQTMHGNFNRTAGTRLASRQ